MGVPNFQIQPNWNITIPEPANISIVPDTSNNLNLNPSMEFLDMDSQELRLLNSTDLATNLPENFLPMDIPGEREPHENMTDSFTLRNQVLDELYGNTDHM